MRDMLRNHRKYRDILRGRLSLLGHFVALGLSLSYMSACTQTPVPPPMPVTAPAPAPSPPPIALYGEAPAGGLTCVPYARQRTGVSLQGDAYSWWDNAVGVYQRGSKPALSAILVLPQTSRLKSGHVAVVTQVVNERKILVDHANWIPNEIVTNMPVIDVSPNNDWTQLRFWYAPSNTFGAIYPASGFIYTAKTTQSGIGTVPAMISESDQTVIISGSGVSFSGP
jgi:surface antigen